MKREEKNTGATPAQHAAVTAITQAEKDKTIADRQFEVMLRPFAQPGEFNRAENMAFIQSMFRDAADRILNAGCALICHKANLKHGEFLEDLERYGIPIRMAARAMNAARKLRNVRELVNGANLTASKVLILAEEMTQDEAKELLEGETVGTLTLDQFQRMTTDEAREAARAASKREHRNRQERDSLRSQLNTALDENASLREQQLPADELACMKALSEWEAGFYGQMHRIKGIEPERWQITCIEAAQILSRVAELLEARIPHFTRIQSEMFAAEEEAEQNGPARDSRRQKK
jgi:hypothetical protein